MKQPNVCSFELAKRLKELGVKQDSLFTWRYFKFVDEELSSWKEVPRSKNKGDCP